MDNGAGSYRRFLDGDDDGIVEIVRDYKDGLIFYINSYVNNIHIAEELTEDTFFKLIVKKPKYRYQYSFKAWLYTIGRNVSLDYLRKNSRILDKPADDYYNYVQDEINLEKEYFKEERKILVRHTIDRLKPEYRQVLYLVYFEGFSNEETAKITKKNKHQIETLVYRAKQSLKSKLEKEGFTYEEL